MNLHTKFNLKQYYIYARRDKRDKWTDWTQSNDLERAVDHIQIIRDCGFLAKLYDRVNDRVVVIDG